MNVVHDDVEKLADKERITAEERFPMFASPHESYAVILEEYEECRDDLTYMGQGLDQMWDSVKQNENGGIRSNLSGIRDYAIECAVEAIQVAAMCDKALRSMESKK
jgi:hypothetical protein